MVTFLYVLYTLVCLFLILVVLLQAGRGGMGTAFGGNSQAVFGGSGAGNFLTRLTVISAAMFMLLSATLTYVSSSGEKSLEKVTEKVRLREEARTAASKKGASTKAPPPAEQSSPDGTPAAPEGAAAPVNAAPIEAAPAGSAANAVDQALKKLDAQGKAGGKPGVVIMQTGEGGAKPIELPAATHEKPSAPAPVPANP